MRTFSDYPVYFALPLASLVLSACLIQLFEPQEPDPDPTPTAVDLAVGLHTATPESQGFVVERLTEAIGSAQEITGLKSLLVIRNGKLVVEEYFGDTTADEDGDLWGMTNAVLAALVGIAIEEGLIDDESQTISELLPDQRFEIAEELQSITVRHLLTMSSGLEWREVNNGPEFTEWLNSADHVNYVLRKPLQVASGKQFNYNSGTVHLLSAILSQASGVTTRRFAEAHLLEPIGVEVPEWHTDSAGFHFAHGLHLRPRDIAKLGVLFIQQGVSGGEQVVPRTWIERTCRSQFPVGFWVSTLQAMDYGYLWWIEGRHLNQVFLAWGYAGQFLYLVPDRNLVIVTTAEWRELNYDEVISQEREILDLIGNQILPAARPIVAFSGQ